MTMCIDISKATMAMKSIFKSKHIHQYIRKTPPDGGEKIYTVEIFARPLMRRRFKTARPAFDAIRARKPCVRARCRVCGW